MTTADLRLAQEIPLGWKDLRAMLTLDVENLANLINNDWGQLRQVQLQLHGAGAAGDDQRGDRAVRVLADDLGRSTPEKAFRTSISALPSVWRVQLGFRIEF